MIEEYEYIRVDMTPKEIAHAMVDGEMFFTFDGEFLLYWNPYSGFVNNKGNNITLLNSFYKRIENNKKAMKVHDMTEEYEYIKVEGSIFDLKDVKVTGSIFDLKDDLESGKLFHKTSFDHQYVECKSEASVFYSLGEKQLYKRIKKEREFNEGEWYPCIDRSGENSIYIHSNGRFFIDEFKSDFGCDASSMKWIGESLGKIEFGE